MFAETVFRLGQGIWPYFGAYLSFTFFAGLVCVVIFAALLIREYLVSRKEKIETNRWVELEVASIENLRALNFVFCIHYGKRKFFVADPKRRRAKSEIELWSDTNFVVVVQRKDRPVGLIGFEITEDSIEIKQLQGIKGSKLHDIDIGDQFLTWAEEIACTLHKRYVKVIHAHLTTYYELDELHDLYPQLYAHQNRLRQIYNDGPKKRGYQPMGTDWYVKKLIEGAN